MFFYYFYSGQDLPAWYQTIFPSSFLTRFISFEVVPATLGRGWMSSPCDRLDRSPISNHAHLLKTFRVHRLLLQTKIHYRVFTRSAKSHFYSYPHQMHTDEIHLPTYTLFCYLSQGHRSCRDGFHLSLTTCSVNVWMFTSERLREAARWKRLSPSCSPHTTWWLQPCFKRGSR